MGNVSHKFLTVFLTLFMPLIIFLNLLAFGHLFGFHAYEGNAYFGFSSLMDSFALFDDMIDTWSLGVFDPEHMNTFAMSGLNHFSFGVNDFLTDIVDGRIWQATFKWDFGTFPRPTQIMNYQWEGDNVLEVVRSIGRFLTACGDYLQDIASFYVNGFGIIGSFFKFLFNFVHQPVLVLLDMVYILLYVLFYGFILLVWIAQLINGKIYKPLPSENYSEWSSMIEGWEDTWSSVV